MIDTHAHIDADAFDGDFEETVERAFAAGVESIIIPAIEPKFFDRTFEAARFSAGIYCSVGVHPHNSSEVTDEILDRIKELSFDKKCVAIGEIGLDYFYDFNPKDVQKVAFRKQLQIAKERDLPVIVHNRDSDDDLYEILKSEQDGTLRGVLHCFSSDGEFMKKALDLGFLVSFTGNVTFKKSTLADVVAGVPNDKFMLETDSPYMTPVPKRGKRNEPALVRLVAEKIAELKSLSIDEVISMTTKNAKDLFKIATILAVFFLTAFNMHAQDGRNEEEEVYEAPADPFPKTWGIGPLFGANTIVDMYPEGDKRSSDGIFAIGGFVQYRALRYLILEGTYTYSKNSTLSKRFDVDPNYHNTIELTTHWIPNPSGRINFFGTLGLTYFMNKVGVNDYANNGKSNKYFDEENELGMNGGFGILINFNLPNKAGVLGVIGEWRVMYKFAARKYTYDNRRNPLTETALFNKPTETSTFFSIPRLGIAWYPNL